MGTAVVNLDGDHVGRLHFAADVVVELSQVGGQREDNLTGGEPPISRRKSAAAPAARLTAVVLMTRGYSEMAVMVVLLCLSG